MFTQFNEAYDVTFTEQHLQRAGVGSRCCLLAEAIRDIFPACVISVGTDRVIIKDEDGSRAFRYWLDETARRTINMYDNGQYKDIQFGTFRMSAGHLATDAF